MDYEDVDSEISETQTQQQLTFYELDLGLNHVVRKYSEVLEEHGNFLISVPGGNDGPSGVLICSENYITYKNFGDQPDIRCPIPRRRGDLDDPDRGMIFVCSASHKTKSMFFFLAQSEQGDIFKINLEVDDDIVTAIKIKYFDTVPVATSLCVLRTGFLFVAAEFGNHYLYQIVHLGDNDNEPEFSSSMPLDEAETFYFTPRSLKNLFLVDEIESLSPIMHCQIADVANEETPQLLMACGRGPRSTFRLLRHGLEVSEMAVSELPANPNAVWTVKKRSEDKFDSYIVVSFANATLVLSIGETVEEITDSGFLGSTQTINCAQIGDDALIQVYPDGIRHIRADKRVNEWRAPGRKQIVRCAINSRQVVIALSGGEIVYFEMDITGQLNEYTERKDMKSEVICMTLGDVPPGEQRCRFLAIGLADISVRIISLDPLECLKPLTFQVLPARPESLSIVQMMKSDDKSKGKLYLNVGLQNGVHLRTVLDENTGSLSDPQTRYLGSRPIKLFQVCMQGKESLLALSSRTWLCYYYQNRFHLTPLSYEPLEYASGFSSEQCPEGIVAVSQNTLRILALENLGNVFNQQLVELEYTPRKFCIHPETYYVVMIETDHNAFTPARKIQQKQLIAQKIIDSAPDDERQQASEMAAAYLNENLPENIFGAPKPGLDSWASLIRVFNPINGQTLHKIFLDQDEAAFSICGCRFTNDPTSYYVLVGIAKRLRLIDRQHSGCEIHTYKFESNLEQLTLVHKTPVEDVPRAMASFQGKVIIAVGKLLRIYDLGKKKLLKKCENKSIQNFIVTINCKGNRIIAGDVQESYYFIRYKRSENQLIVFADDVFPRWVTCTCILDYDTIAGADKFGNISIIRLAPDVNDEIDDDPTGLKSLWDRGWLGGASQKADAICNFHVGDQILSLNRATLIPGFSESLVYTTISGAIGVLVPFTSHEQLDFFQHLEMHMRSENAPLCGRDHLAYRSFYFPVKNVIDGDLCEQFNSLDLTKQKNIADELYLAPVEVSKKLEDMRTQYAF
ncbi:DNA polymerase beta-like [Sarcoptes scabiei]|nr:DNA polymerase beta-like [Sarcoptes scabiei]